jgi:catechol 2,3-dioxygenase-like lactoylglutathione lyase family enzyme
MAIVRYIVDDVAAAVAFYTGPLGFVLVRQYGPAMAILTRGDLELWCAGPPSSAAKPMPDGRRPMPGGWSRIVLAVEGLEALAATLAKDGVVARGAIVSGPGGRQLVIDDPAGNAIELFEAAPA